MSKWCATSFLLRLEREEEPDQWKQLDVGVFDGIRSGKVEAKFWECRTPWVDYSSFFHEKRRAWKDRQPSRTLKASSISRDAFAKEASKLTRFGSTCRSTSDVTWNRDGRKMVRTHLEEGLCRTQKKLGGNDGEAG